MKNRISKSFMLLAFTVMVIGTLTGLSVNNSLAGLSPSGEQAIVSNDLLASTDASSALKCGEGKCGDGKTSAKPESKEKAETSMKCGDGKCGDGKASEKTDKTEEVKADQKTESKDSKCGDG